MPQGPGPKRTSVNYNRKTDTLRYKEREIKSEYFPERGRQNISDFAPLFRNLAQTSHFEVSFGGLPRELKQYLKDKGIDNEFIFNDLGLLCYNTVIPTSASTTTVTQGNRTGIIEEFAHTRQYDNLALSFYVDKDYKVLKFFENWVGYIHSGSEFNEVDDNYFIRNRYPEDYKINLLKIYKFDRDYRTVVPYTFKKIFPRQITPIQVDYTTSEILKLNVTLHYERYIAGDVTPNA